MKCLHINLLLILLCVVKYSTADEKSHFFRFRQKTLDTFNGARRLLAGGDLRKIADLVKNVVSLKTYCSVEILGPAANMYQLKWSRDLEQIGYEYTIDESPKPAMSIIKSITYKDHIGFTWQGNIVDILNTVIPLPGDFLRQAFHEFMEFLETLVTVIWLAVAAPKKIPIPRGETFGPAEALFGERAEIGCFAKLFTSVCFVKKLPYSESMFKEGVPCTSCPTHCEYWEEEDGTIEEGELCVPPKEPQMNYVAGNMTQTDSTATNYFGFAMAFPIALIVAQFNPF